MHAWESDLRLNPGDVESARDWVVVMARAVSLPFPFREVAQTEYTPLPPNLWNH